MDLRSTGQIVALNGRELGQWRRTRIKAPRVNPESGCQYVGRHCKSSGPRESTMYVAPSFGLNQVVSK